MRDKDAIAKCNALNDCMKLLMRGPARRLEGIPTEILNEFQFLTAKPLMYVANTDEGTPDESLLKPLRDRAASEGAPWSPYATKLEAISSSYRLRSAMNIINPPASPHRFGAPGQAGKELLKLICFFTAGPQETRLADPSGTAAVKAAGRSTQTLNAGYPCRDL